MCMTSHISLILYLWTVNLSSLPAETRVWYACCCQTWRQCKELDLRTPQNSDLEFTLGKFWSSCCLHKAYKVLFSHAYSKAEQHLESETFYINYHRFPIFDLGQRSGIISFIKHFRYASIMKYYCWSPLKFNKQYFVEIMNTDAALNSVWKNKIKVKLSLSPSCDPAITKLGFCGKQIVEIPW